MRLASVWKVTPCGRQDELFLSVVGIAYPAIYTCRHPAGEVKVGDVVTLFVATDIVDTRHPDLRWLVDYGYPVGRSVVKTINVGGEPSSSFIIPYPMREAGPIPASFLTKRTWRRFFGGW